MTVVPTTVKYDAAGPDSWSWPGDVTIVAAEFQIWSGGAGGEDNIPPERGGAAGSGGGSKRITVCRGEEAAIDFVVGDGGGPGEAGEDSYVTQGITEVARVTGAAATTVDGDDGAPGAPGDGTYDGGLGEIVHGVIHTMFGDLPAELFGGRGGSSAGFNKVGTAGADGLIPPPGGGAGGLAGLSPEADGGATDGEDAPGRGGGGGGGGQGKASGSGHAGEIWVTYPPTQKGGRCCCNEGCPACTTRESLGLPLTLSAGFAVASSTADGIPADGDNGQGCVGHTSLYVWSEGNPLAPILSGEFEFIEQADEGCCFLYRSVGDYDPECGDSGSDLRTVSNPYPKSAIGGSVVSLTFTGRCLGPPDGFWPYLECDHTTPVPLPSCTDTCAGSIGTTGGELFIPLPIFGSVDLLICVSGNTVTISAGSAPVIPCRTYTGNCSYQDATPGYPFPSGDPCADNIRCDEPESTGCADPSGCSTRRGTVYFSATADLSGTAGATIWDRIKSYSGWSGGYGESSCSCASGGCTDEKTAYLCGCVCVINCYCGPGDPDDPTIPICASDETPAESAVDVPCLYASGTMTASFS